MREIYIKYNPYRLETTVLIDEMPPKQNSKLNFSDRRLQEWIEELPEILFEECNTRDFKLTFHGTILDYEDVEAMVYEAKNQGINIELAYIPAKEVSDKETAITEIFDEIQSGPFDELKQPDVIKAFNMAKSSDFEVNVVATMSAGKSTLINALLGQKLMPAKQEACTATITEIKDNDSDGFMAKVYNTDGRLIQTYAELSFEIMEELNSNPEVSKIRIEGDIPFVTSEDVALVLVDTPGPNNSRDPEHKAATYRMLSESSKTVVLYILNATQLAVNDDYNLLSYVADSMKVGGKQSRDRFIFVVNKLDDFKKGEDSIEAAITKVRDYLRDNGVENPNIYPASALTALNIRTILAESDDEDDDEVYEANGKVRKFNRNDEMYFETLAPLPPSARGKMEAKLADARESGDKNVEALIHCGIIPIEMAIQMYVQKYAKTAKIKNIADTFSKRLESAKSFEKTKQEITENQDKQKKILANIEAIKQKLESGEDAKRFRDKVDKINYDSEIEKLAKGGIILAARRKINDYLTHAEIGEKIGKREAEQYCSQFACLADDLQAEVHVQLEQLIENHVYKNASDLLDEYKKKISELGQDMNVGEIGIDPFELMTGDISTDVSSLINSLTQKEKVKVDEKWIENQDRKWYKPWTWLQEKGHWEDVLEEKSYINGENLAQRFFMPITDQLYENADNAVEYAKKQTRKIKQEFSKKFVELDAILKKKLQELENCANDKKDIERRIHESNTKLKWLEDIQFKITSILEI